MEAERHLIEYFKANAGGQIYTIYKAYLEEQRASYNLRLVQAQGDVETRWLQGRLQQLDEMLLLLKPRG